jgi:hypothetical protein
MDVNEVNIQVLMKSIFKRKMKMESENASFKQKLVPPESPL